MAEEKELKEQQVSLSIEEQIENLKSLQLEIPDEKFAKDFLNENAF